MPIYNTPAPIDLAIDLPVGLIEIVASDRTDTVVTLSPTNPAKANDRRGVEETRVDFDGQRLVITGPRPRLAWIGPSESIDLKVELPTGSRLTAEIAVGDVRATGRLGATRIKASTGAVDLDRTGNLWLRASYGSVTLGTAEGGIEIIADHGQIRVGKVTGDAILKSSYGTLTIGEAGGDLDAKLSYGDLEITRALASVVAKTAYGRVHLREVSSGSVEVESGYGQITIGVRDGVSAWLDLSAKNGRLRNQLDGDRAPDASRPTVAIRARAQSGDILVQRVS